MVFLSIVAAGATADVLRDLERKRKQRKKMIELQRVRI